VKVALVCGPCPPGACGVGDYTVCLARSLNLKGIETHVIFSGDWNLPRALQRCEESPRAKFDAVHIQYPTVGFGGSLIPHGLALLQRCVVTVHEASRAHILRKLALLPFSIRPRRLVFTSECERQFAVRWAPWISQVSCVIPITSNISAFEGASKRSLDEILYFGLIMPNKGLENVIALGELLKASGLSLKIRMVGSSPPKYGAYFEDLKSRTSTFPIIWDHTLTDQQVAMRLASSSIAYLPYPDGVSERRATFKAALLNGVTVITTRGKHTPSELEGLVSFCASPEEALVAIRFLAANTERRAELADRGRRYARRFTWDSIAEAHFELYTQILAPKNGRERIALKSPEADNHLDSTLV
jgi:glycosyltransferase involved in cell wall biosynthesis